jgi:transposase-like protein
MDFPEPLFESTLHHRKACLVCGKNYATKVLRTTDREIVPVCDDCSSDWNLYGYQILKRIKPGRLIRRLMMFKLGHPFRPPSWRAVGRDLRGLTEWAKKMKRWMR